MSSSESYNEHLGSSEKSYGDGAEWWLCWRWEINVMQPAASAGCKTREWVALHQLWTQFVA